MAGGTFASAADAIFNFKSIVCVEPDQDLLPMLRSAVRNPSKAIYNTALSDRAGTQQFHVLEDRRMSSLLAPDPQVLREKFPKCKGTQVARPMVSTMTLDELVQGEPLVQGRRLLLKLDTQGNELAILRKGTAALAQTGACLVEFMFTTPYERVFTFRELIDFMDDHGFVCIAVTDVMRRPTHEISGTNFLFVPTSRTLA